MITRIFAVILLMALGAVLSPAQAGWNDGYITLASNDDHDENDNRRRYKPAPVPKPKNIKVIQQQAAHFETSLRNRNQANATGGTGGSVSIRDEAAASGAASTYLTATHGTCMGSSGIAGQGMNFGFSVGTTWRDDKCDMRRDAAMLNGMGQPLAAFMRLCQDDQIAMSLKYAGRPCPKALRDEMQRIGNVLVLDEPTE